MTLNETFRAAYRRTKEANLAHGGPVILTEGDNVVLRRGGSRLEVPYTPAVYHVLKAVAHVPLALDVILAPHAGEETLDDATLAELREYRQRIEEAEPTLATHGLEPESLERSRTIFAECRAFPRFGRKGAAMPARGEGQVRPPDDADGHEERRRGRPGRARRAPRARQRMAVGDDP